MLHERGGMPRSPERASHSPLARPRRRRERLIPPSVNRRSLWGMRAEGLAETFPGSRSLFPLGKCLMSILWMPFPALLDREGGGMLPEEEGLLR